MVQVNESGTGGVETARFAAFGGALRISADWQFGERSTSLSFFDLLLSSPWGSRTVIEGSQNKAFPS
ncbi:hypothetical protein [Alicyclobacillus fastidiosus]|uniref:Uncharacterized protein n=1 Tax=Alicyclobacillus fastidiosus TaxID=392011 RepID=A0ABV5AH47_9BACL|nr:hypothetical protein [Alicyclobacillus fastidiosus]WEH08119.1 hypothetical protein PYS47_15530 [Alicyclobacillus fastidiosus]